MRSRWPPTREEDLSTMVAGHSVRVSEGTRTTDRLDHNRTESVYLSLVYPVLQGLVFLSFSEFSSVW